MKPRNIEQYWTQSDHIAQSIVKPRKVPVPCDIVRRAFADFRVVCGCQCCERCPCLAVKQLVVRDRPRIREGLHAAPLHCVYSDRQILLKLKVILSANLGLTNFASLTCSTGTTAR